jgi:hypothetical protein
MSEDTGTGSEPTRSLDGSGATDRRAALKKAALAAGVVAWTTPVVQVISTGTAHAQTVTGCRPTVLLQGTIDTGPNCGCVPPGFQPSSAHDPQCCDQSTVVPRISATCGPTCPGTATVNSYSVTAGASPPCNVLPRCDVGVPSVTITIRATITCADGVARTVTQTVTMSCLVGRSQCFGDPAGAATAITSEGPVATEPVSDLPLTEPTTTGPPAANVPPARQPVSDPTSTTIPIESTGGTSP